jgi:hypothetical protein
MGATQWLEDTMETEFEQVDADAVAEARARIDREHEIREMVMRDLSVWLADACRGAEDVAPLMIGGSEVVGVWTYYCSTILRTEDGRCYELFAGSHTPSAADVRSQAEFDAKRNGHNMTEWATVWGVGEMSRCVDCREMMLLENGTCTGRSILHGRCLG